MSKVKIIDETKYKIATDRANKIIRDVRKQLSSQYEFEIKEIGSQTRSCVVKDINGKFDLDFQVLLLPKKILSQADPNNADKVKKDFFAAFTKCKNYNERVENSKTVVTVRVSNAQGDFIADKEIFSLDFVILNTERTMRIRKQSPNSFIWVELPHKYDDAYAKYAKMTEVQKQDMLENDLLPKVLAEKSKKDPEIREATISIFLQSVNNYDLRKKI